MREYLEAVKSLAAVTQRRAHLDKVVGESSFATQISYGVLRNYYSLNATLEQLLDSPLAPKHADLRLLLLAGLYAVRYLERPPYASVNAAVDATGGLKKPWAKGLVNGVLRQFLRNPPDSGRSLEAKLDHPAWMITEIRNAWPDRPDIFRSNNLRAPLTLRVNLRRISRGDYLALLAHEGVDARAGNLTETAVTLNRPMPANKIPGFDDGLASVQDEGAQLAAVLLDPRPGMSVLDACAAPGGKTCHLLEQVTGAEVIAIDLYRRRMEKLEENLSRLGLSCRTQTMSLLDYPGDRSRETGFDRILLDAPCSATGIIRRHPDIKLLRNRSDVDKLCELQGALLDRAFSLLAPAGELLYSTCSILPRENERMIADLLARQPAARAKPLTQPARSASVSTRHGLQFFPEEKTHDGFFYARIQKNPR